MEQRPKYEAQSYKTFITGESRRSEKNLADLGYDDVDFLDTILKV